MAVDSHEGSKMKGFVDAFNDSIFPWWVVPSLGRSVRFEAGPSRAELPTGESDRLLDPPAQGARQCRPSTCWQVVETAYQPLSYDAHGESSRA
jgi:hypothetical protein